MSNHCIFIIGPQYVELWPNKPNIQTNGREVRTTTIREWKEDSTSKTRKCCFVIDAARLWNQLTPDMKDSETLNQAKTATRIIANYFLLAFGDYIAPKIIIKKSSLSDK